MPPSSSIDAVSGAEVQTEKVWQEAEALGLPKLVVLNRLDRERSSVERALASIREACSRIVTPIHIPIGEERGFTGVVDLVTMKAYTYATDASGKFRPKVRCPPAWPRPPTPPARRSSRWWPRPTMR